MPMLKLFKYLLFVCVWGEGGGGGGGGGGRREREGWFKQSFHIAENWKLWVLNPYLPFACNGPASMYSSASGRWDCLSFQYTGIKEKYIKLLTMNKAQ